MALFCDGQICYLCGQAMKTGQDLLGFTFVTSGDPLVRPLDDSVCHRACLSQWSERDRFVRAWNKEAMYILGTKWFLDVNARGEVHYLTRLDRLRYAMGWKRSVLLPKPVSRTWPLLIFSLYNGCRTPFTLKYNHATAHSAPTAKQLGVRSQLVEAIDLWLGDYQALCDADCEADVSLPGRSRHITQRGREIWQALCDDIGDRYRVVHVAPGCILEPESRQSESSR